MFKKNTRVNLSGFKNLTGLVTTAWFLMVLMPLLCHAELKDPTKPNYPPQPVVSTDSTGAAVAPVEEKLLLSAIWISANGKWATINGVTAKPGQTILNQVKILKITQHAVSLSQNGNIKTLRLLNQSLPNK